MSGLVTDGVLNTGGLSHFGDKKNWELTPGLSGSWGIKPTNKEITAEEKEVERFVWLTRVGTNQQLMKNYVTYFKTTDSLAKFFQSVRVRFAARGARPAVSRMHLQGLELNAMALYRKYLKDFIGGTHGLANLENLVFQQLLPLPRGAIADFASQLRAILSFTNKTVDISPAAMQSKGMLLYSTAAFSLRDAVFTSQLATLVVQLSTMARVVGDVVGLRFPALIKAHALTEAYSTTSEALAPTARAVARAKLERDVADVFSNLPVIENATTFDASPIVSVGLSEAVVAGLAPTLVHYKEMFAPSNPLPEDGPSSLFSAALATGLESSWFPALSDDGS